MPMDCADLYLICLEACKTRKLSDEPKYFKKLTESADKFHCKFYKNVFEKRCKPPEEKDLMTISS